MAILCSKCYQALEQTHHQDATYVIPCGCAEGREKEVAQAAATYALQASENHFSDIVEAAIGETVLDDGTATNKQMEELDSELCRIVRQDTNILTEVDTDVYEDLDV